MAPFASRLMPGSPSPLGATCDGLGTNFAVFSANAERMELCLFDPSGRREIARMPLPECTDEIWHGYLPDAQTGLLYGYRAQGPYDPPNGYRFNHYKLLIDPYARRFAGEMRWSSALFGYRVNSSRADVSVDRRDSARGTLKAVVTDEAFNWGDDRPPAVPWADTVIYEAHLRGLTLLREDIRPHERGTFAALGATLSFRGLDNSSYYRLVPGNRRHCVNDTGTGNTFNLSHPRVLQMVMDSLRYWVTSFHVDGFRFDLGVTLGREPHGFDPGAGFFDALRQDPMLSRVKLISEPWDIGPGGYQLGQHPPGFAEWNDRYRDGLRRFWRGDAGQRPDFAARLAGSSDLFDRRARRPWASGNSAASHDGYTLAYTVSYVERHNESNRESTQDGHNENYSANWGVEGPTQDLQILDTRAHVQRAMLATTFFAHGTPMLLAGDEFGRSQQGNISAYCQDNELSWLDVKQAASPEGQALAAFVARLLARRHAHPVLRCRHFMHGKGQPAPGIADISWFDQQGEAVSVEAWNNPDERVIVLRRASRDEEGAVPALTLFLNPTGEGLTFRIPPPHVPMRMLIDTDKPDAPERDLVGETIEVALRRIGLVG